MTLALEPEAAAIYCKHMEFYRQTHGGEGAGMAQFDPGTQFMVVDMGGNYHSAIFDSKNKKCTIRSAPMVTTHSRRNWTFFILVIISCGVT